MKVSLRIRVSWRHFTQFWALESSQQLRMCPKLTEAHFFLPMGQKMNVAKMTQVFSHSLAAAMRAYIKKHRLPKVYATTADFAEGLNDLFDMGNSCSISDQGAKAPITVYTLDQSVEKLEGYIRWITNWRFEDQRPAAGEKKRLDTLPFKKGLMVTLKALAGLVQYLIQEKGFQYVCTKRFLQDCLENVFSVIRRNGGGFNDHPESQPAVQSLRALTCAKVLDPSSHANCEATGDRILLHLGKEFLVYYDRSFLIIICNIGFYLGFTFLILLMILTCTLRSCRSDLQVREAPNQRSAPCSSCRHSTEVQRGVSRETLDPSKEPLSSASRGYFIHRWLLSSEMDPQGGM